MESVYSKKEDCSGCAACRDLCPTGAIAMLPDAERFAYPRIDRESCIDCGLCASVCPLIKEGHYKSADASAFFAARHKSDEVLKSSTSGGAFTALSDAVLAVGGTVYGADFDEAFRVLHRRAETPAQRDRMRFSKYVQSGMDGIYAQMRDDLRAGRSVLFTGTPCQTAGMRARFRTPQETGNLFLCDVICHSVPSPRVWEDYKRLLAEEAGAPLVHVQFRSKEYAWSRENSNKGFLYGVEGEEKMREDDRFHDLFIRDNRIVRPSCHACRFTDAKRASDITIADYWGIEAFAPELYDPLGVSLVMVNTPQGRRLFEMAGTAMEIRERPPREALSQQKRLSRPGKLPMDREAFWDDYERNGLAAVLKRL